MMSKEGGKKKDDKKTERKKKVESPVDTKGRWGGVGEKKSNK